MLKIYFISTFSFFLVFDHDFIIHIDFIHIAASNTATMIHHKFGHTQNI